MIGNSVIGFVANNYGIETGFSLLVGYLACVILCMFAVLQLNKRQQTAGKPS